MGCNISNMWMVTLVGLLLMCCSVSECWRGGTSAVQFYALVFWPLVHLNPRIFRIFSANVWNSSNTSVFLNVQILLFYLRSVVIFLFQIESSYIGSKLRPNIMLSCDYFLELKYSYPQLIGKTWTTNSLVYTLSRKL